MALRDTESAMGKITPCSLFFLLGKCLVKIIVGVLCGEILSCRNVTFKCSDTKEHVFTEIDNKIKAIQILNIVCDFTHRYYINGILVT